MRAAGSSLWRAEFGLDGAASADARRAARE